MTLQIEVLADGDFRDVADLWYQSWLSTGAEHGEGVTPDVLERRLRGEPWDIWVARLDAKVAAFLAIDRKDACLSQLFVAPEFQNRTIGRRMFELAQREMPFGFWLRTDESNTGARRFYERKGLECECIEAGRAYYRLRPKP
ncbi:GNAT family N-acetyltransferase [Erythrobacter ani]|uniref:GNAT family N-acetyltransferase n=1 Tax=Erythrobacter ani TaxID=2827235 RepID=A0ABS6SIE5_9SPHN|nr:GNAT family N-acetyltransferase [Erythrobacter ani]MBV7264783.1 GNAT family N-acetyltransferase [Erythrobacter ani]